MTDLPAAITLLLLPGPCSRQELRLCLLVHPDRVERATDRLLRDGHLVEVLDGGRCLLALRGPR